MLTVNRFGSAAPLAFVLAIAVMFVVEKRSRRASSKSVPVTATSMLEPIFPPGGETVYSRATGNCARSAGAQRRTALRDRVNIVALRQSTGAVSY